MRVYIETYGCEANRADSELMKTILAERGHVVVKEPESADVIIINTCTVRMPTEKRMLDRIRRLLRYGKKLVVAGCLASAEPSLVRRISPKISMLSPQAIEKVAEVVESDEVIYALHPVPRTRLPAFRRGVVFSLPVAEGCLGNCAYCIVRIARGPLRSYPPRQIVCAVKKAVEEGAKEIRITAQDTASYGKDIGFDLARLLEEICSVDGEFMVRVGMMNPDTALPILDELMEVYANPKIYKFLHLPLQSGDDRVLKRMNRRYTVEDFLHVVEVFRRKFEEGFLATDIIVGLPGEDEEAFERTKEVLREAKPEKVHLARYTPRPHTLAAVMEQVPEKIKHARSRELTRLCQAICEERLSRFVGRKMRGLVIGESPKGEVEIRAENYCPVYVNSRLKEGYFVEVRITGVARHGLLGAVVG